MIEVINLNKTFDGTQALRNMNIHVKKGSIYGLVGTNGSGKTTLIKHLVGILKPDSGEVQIDGQPVYENTRIKERIALIPDDLSFWSGYTLKDASLFFKSIYPKWNEDRYIHMMSMFQFSEKRRIQTLSKGMQKQAAFVLCMSTLPDYLILDEPIDGLDPIVRKMIWKFVVNDVAEREMTTLVSSHNLREMEGICDSIGILSRGEMKIERDLDELKADIHKVQVAFNHQGERPYEGLNVLYKEVRGSVDLLIVRNPKKTVESIIEKNNPVIFDMLPLTLEEIFIYELGGENYDEKIIF